MASGKLAILIVNLVVAAFFSHLFLHQNASRGEPDRAAIESIAKEAKNSKHFQFAEMSGNLSWCPEEECHSPKEARQPTIDRVTKIKLRRSGGFAGLTTAYELDANLLSPAETSQLQTLVQRSGLLQANSQHTPDGRDLINYEITIQTERCTHTVSFDDLSLPETAKPLIDYLERKSGYENSTGRR
jgi:hypothetical protein